MGVGGGLGGGAVEGVVLGGSGTIRDVTLLTCSKRQACCLVVAPCGSMSEHPINTHDTFSSCLQQNKSIGKNEGVEQVQKTLSHSVIVVG